MLLRLLATVVVCVSAAAAVPGTSAQAPQPSSADLFDPVRPDLAAADAALARPGTIAARLTAVNPAAFDADVIRLALFDGAVYSAERTRIETQANGAAVWVGEVPDQLFSSVTLSRLGDVVQGSVRVQGAAYSIEPAGSGQHLIRLVDESQYRRELAPLVPRPGPLPEAAAQSFGDDGNTFDLLVVYTAAAASATGSQGGISARISLGVAETNTALRNSWVNAGDAPQVRLVGVEQIGYTELPDDMATDLDRLTGASDGYMDAVHARRDALGADQVKLIVHTPAGSACGVAWLMESHNTGAFAPYAFSVTDQVCISPAYTFGHELAHNWGSNHAPDDQVSQSPFRPYSFGYKHPSNLFRTIMAYPCMGASCPRILHYSSPLRTYSGAPTGTAAQHDNARSVNEARGIVSNWRQSVAGASPTISSIANRTTPEDTPTAAIPFTVADADTPVDSLIVTAVSSNTALVANSPASLTLGGSGGSRTLAITPVANASGTTTITMTVSDGINQASTTFTLTVTAVSDPPVVAANPTSATVPQNFAAQTMVTVSDIDTPGLMLGLAASSSNQSLLPNANLTVTPVAVYELQRTFQVLMTPVGGQQGTATVTLTGSDVEGTGTATFQLTVAAPGATPVISAIGAQTMDEDTTRSVPFSLSDSDTPLAALTVQASSSNPGLVTAAGLVIGGSGGSRSVTITPAASQYGTAFITLTVSDGVNTSQTAFPVTVTAVNDAPGFGAATPTSVTTGVNTASTVYVTLTDIDSSGSALDLSAVSSTPALLPPGGLTVTLVSESASSRTFAVTVTPAPGAMGTGTVELTATDGQAGGVVTRNVEVLVVSSVPAPNPPSSASALASQSQVTILWLPATTGARASSYVVELGTSPGATAASHSVSAAETAFVLSLPDGTYFGRVRAVNGAGSSAPSPEFTVSVGSAALIPGPPGAFAVTTSGISATFTWTAPTTGAQPAQYVLEAGTGPGQRNIASLVTANNLPWFTVQAVPPGRYYVRVRGRTAAGMGPPSQELMLVMGTTGRCTGLAGAPVLLTPIVSGNTVTLSWTAATTGSAAESFVVMAGSQPGASNLAVIDTKSPGTSFVAQAPNGVYFVRVAARNACGDSPVSNEITLTVGPAAPGQPSALDWSVAARIVTLTWQAPSSGGLPAAYIVEAGSGAGLANLAVISTGGTATTFRAMAPPGTYYVRVRGLNSGGRGPASNEVVVVVP
jgi:hypothetical protein